jgi:DNA polymerase-3 subunit alpha
MAENMHNDYADRKNGRQPVSYLHDDAEEILRDTYGLMIYQESVMRIAQKFAGYSLADADNLRKACGKKIREVMEKERASFVEGCDTTGYGAELGHKWFDIIEPFADYAFNKSHSYGYGYIAYQTAYLKANYPTEYLASLLTSVKANLDKAAVYINECRVMGIKIAVPDVNASVSDFRSEVTFDDDGVERRRILFGLSAVRNVGEGLVELLVQERDKNGPFADFYEFCERVDTAVLNKRTIESLINAGGFDSMGHPRQGLRLVYEQILDHTLARRREHDMGVLSLFDDGGEDATPAFDERTDIPDQEYEKSARLRHEKEMLGLYVSDHPLMGAEAALKRRSEHTIDQINDGGLSDGAPCSVGGVITSLNRKYTKKGDLMAVFILEDLQSSIEVMVFPRTMRDVGHLLEEDSVVVLKGRVDSRDDQPKLIAQRVEVFDGISDGAPPVRIRMSPNDVTDQTIGALKKVLADHPGDSAVFLHIGEQKVLRLPDAWTVASGNALMADLRVLLGAEALIT